MDSFKTLASDIENQYHILPAEMLFIDDSQKHIHGATDYLGQGAIAAVLHGLHVKSNLLPLNWSRLSSVN